MTLTLSLLPFQSAIKSKSREIFDKLDFLGINKKDIRALVLSLIELEVGKIHFSCLPHVYYEHCMTELIIYSFIMYDKFTIALKIAIKRMTTMTHLIDFYHFYYLASKSTKRLKHTKACIPNKIEFVINWVHTRIYGLCHWFLFHSKVLNLLKCKFELMWEFMDIMEFLICTLKCYISSWKILLIWAQFIKKEERRPCTTRCSL